MPPITSTRTAAATSMAAPTRVLRNRPRFSANDLTTAFNKLEIKDGRAKRVKAARQTPQAPQPQIAIPPSQASIKNKGIQFDVERLVDQISNMNITKPARKLPKRHAGPVHPYGRPVHPYGRPVHPYGRPVHPYGRPVHTKTEKILSSHGMVKKETPTTPVSLESCANSPAVNFNNATISLLSNAPPSPVAFDTVFNWSTAWLASGSATPTSSPTIEAQLYATSVPNTSNDNWFVNEVVVAITSVVTKELPKQTGKTAKPRITMAKKNAPYTKEKGERKQRPAKSEPVACKFDAEVTSLTDMLSLCEVTKGSKGNARLTRSRALAARKAARHDSGYEGGNED